MAIQYPPIAPPSRLALLKELRLGLDLALSAPRWRTLRRASEGAPRAVVLLPGFGASERSMTLIARHLRRLGHRVFDWGLGRNTGRVPQILAAMRERTESLTAEVGEPLVAVGWSLGGYIARELAREMPDNFRKVVTLGSPVVGGPRFTVVGTWYRDRGFDLDEIEQTVASRYETPLRVPVAAIYSLRDGVVAWQACIDRWSPRVRHIEVSETHVGLGFSPRVLAIVGEEVAGGEE